MSIEFLDPRPLHCSEKQAAESTKPDSNINIQNIISELIAYGEVERPVFVIKFKRDEHGNVIEKIKYPAVLFLSNRYDEITINIEDADGKALK